MQINQCTATAHTQKRELSELSTAAATAELHTVMYKSKAN